MASLLDLTTFTDSRGNLTVVERQVPFIIKRVFYIYGVDNSIRGGHRHCENRQAAICIQGRCIIYCNNGKEESVYELDKPNKCLIIEPEDWHKMYDFSTNAILMVFASEYFDVNDYIHKPY